MCQLYLGNAEGKPVVLLLPCPSPSVHQLARPAVLSWTGVLPLLRQPPGT